MFIASFSTVNSTQSFKADKNHNLPVIGDIKCGTSKGSLYNGTMFKRGGYKEGQLYLCDNKINPETGYQDVVIITEVTALEYVRLKSELGDPVLITANTAGADEYEEE